MQSRIYWRWNCKLCKYVVSMRYRLLFLTLSIHRESCSFVLDIDECLSISCHINADCLDSHGSYLCRCKIGYSGNGTFCESRQMNISALTFILVYWLPYYSIRHLSFLPHFSWLVFLLNYLFRREWMFRLPMPF